MSEPTTDMYTTVERSIAHTLMAAIVAAGGTQYQVFNNMVDKKKFPDCHAAISIMKVADVFTATNGGGPWANIDTPVVVSGAITGYERQPWPDSYDLMYQVSCETDNLDDLRVLENIIRKALRPQHPMYLWDSNATPPAFTQEWIEYHYAGYINRDVPTNNIYNRVLNIRFEARNFPATVTIPAITHIQTTVADSGTTVFDVEVGS